MALSILSNILIIYYAKVTRFTLNFKGKRL
jgi:hypothetical protein